MTKTTLESPFILWIAAFAVLLLVALLFHFYRRRTTRVEQVLDSIGFDRIHNVVLPNADGGEILIDQLLLTTQGLLIVEIKEVQGTVFGSNKMQDWTVIATNRRYTFPNPQPGLYDRIAAVREVVKQIPVAGRVVFLDGAEFSKGVPELVASLDELAAEFGEPDRKSALVKIEAFMPYWENIKKGLTTLAVR
tara:strand:+ start:514 stop:1089 length:576 start_codon:yes stop_codon:yes gene_type:complete